MMTLQGSYEKVKLFLDATIYRDRHLKTFVSENQLMEMAALATL